MRKLTRILRSTRALLVLMVALSMLAAACGADGTEPDGAGTGAEPGDGAGQTGGGMAEDQTLTVANPSTIVGLDPHGEQSAERSTLVTAQHIFDTLVERENKEIVPSVATEWETPDDNTWVFTLRDDVMFHDGSTLTAEDVKASIERVVELDGPFAAQWTLLDSVEATDDTTVTIRTTEPLGTMLTNLSMLAIAPADQMEEDGFWDQPVGSGPFTVESFVPDDRLVLAGNDDYWGGAPTLERLEFVEIPEISARITALETGEIDLTWALPPDQVPTVRNMDQVTFESIPSFVYYFLWFNNSREPFTDVRVRRAMWHAVDVNSIVSDLFGEDLAQVARAPIPEPVFGYAPQEPYEYDPERAQELLAEAGYPDGFETSVMWNTNCCPQVREIAQAMISYWSEVGVTVEPLEKERAEWLDDLLALNWNMDLQTNGVLTGDADWTLGRLYTCEADRLGYCNEEVDEALIGAKSTVDQDERERLYAEATEILWNDAVGIFPMDIFATYAWRDHVQDFSPAPSEIPSFYSVSISG